MTTVSTLINISVLFLMGFGNCYFRGGGLETDDKSNWWGKPAFLLVTALVIYLTQGLSWFILSGTVAMELGMILGWGAYIQAIQGQGAGNRAQNVIIDWLIKPLLSSPVLWGVVGLSLRGLIWSLSLALGLLNVYFIPLGLLMGPVYWLATKVQNKFIDEWKLGEIFFGLVIAAGFILGKKKKDETTDNHS